jgi:non-heme chloroperoxidase
MFTHPLSARAAKGMLRHLQPESYRALWDMTMPNLPRAARVKETPLLVLGAEHDQLIPPSSAEMTARTYGIEAEIFADMGHVVMLERDWHKPAQRILCWLAELGLVDATGETQ